MRPLILGLLLICLGTSITLAQQSGARVPVSPKVNRSLLGFDLPPKDQVVRDLKKGGFIIVFRHAKTDSSQKDLQKEDYGNCTLERNLSDEGRDQARKLAEAFKALGIPVGRVLSSPMCRCKETATLAFGSTEPTRALVGDGAEDIAARAKLLGRLPDPGTNDIWVTHTTCIASAFNIPQNSVMEGGCIVAKPQEDATYKIMASISFDDWRVYGSAGGMPDGPSVDIAKSMLVAANTFLDANGLKPAGELGEVVPADENLLLRRLTSKGGDPIARLEWPVVAGAPRDAAMSLLSTGISPHWLKRIQGVIDGPQVRGQAGACILTIQALNNAPNAWRWSIESADLSIGWRLGDSRVLAAQPFTITAIGPRVALLASRDGAALRLIDSLSDAQRFIAIDDKSPISLSAKPTFDDTRGLLGSGMTVIQRIMLREMILSATEILPSGVPSRAGSSIEADGLDKVRFLWIGATSDPAAPRSQHIMGPGFSIGTTVIPSPPDAAGDGSVICFEWRELPPDAAP